jgi:hypothetical protein
MKIIRIADRRQQAKNTGSMRVPMPASSPYTAVYVFSKEASQLYGAGTKWCTTVSEDDKEFAKVHRYNPHDYQEMYPNLIYFIHKTHKISDDSQYYKLALQIDDLWRHPLFYTYDAQNQAMQHEPFLERLGVQSFWPFVSFLKQNTQAKVKTIPVTRNQMQATASNKLDQFPCILFLDIDGVLNTEDSSGVIDYQFVVHLNHILQQTNAGIVLSTGWRNSNGILGKLAAAGIDGFQQRYIGAIPDLGAEMNWWNETEGANRADEIKAWLGENDYKGRYAVLDDREHLLNEDIQLFWCNPQTGLTKEVADQVVKHLKF